MDQGERVTFEYEQGFAVIPEAQGGSEGAKAPYIDHGTNRIDSERYVSQTEADLEWDKMWTKSWSFAGIAHDIPEVGDYFKIDIGRESFIITRTGPGEKDIAAYFNVCPHRGNRIAHGDFGSVGEDGCFRCDFHGWRFGIDGKNKEIRDELLFRKETIAHRPGLKTVRCDIWNSLIFISMDPSVRPLLEHLDVIPEHLANYPIHEYRVLADVEVCWDANWKTAMDAFLEFYHADDVHPEVIPFVDTLHQQYDLYEHGISRMIIPVGLVGLRHPDRTLVPAELKSFVEFYGGNNDEYAHLEGWQYRQALIDTKRKWAKRHGHNHFERFNDSQVVDNWNYFAFPNITLGMFSDQMLIQSFRPHPTDPSKSYYRVISLNLPVGGTQEMVMDSASFGPEALSPPGWDGSIRPPIKRVSNIEDFGPLIAQDARRVPEVQKGIKSMAYDGYILSEFEIRIRHYLAEIDRWLGRR